MAVADPADPRLDDYRALRDRDLAPRRTFVVEGALALEQLLASGYEVRSVLVAERRLAAVAPLLAGRQVLVGSDEVLGATVGFAIHRGVLAAGVRPPPADPAAVVASGPLLAVLEGVNDHENLGALFRTARALGVAGVLTDPTCADPLYRRSIRVSLGHVLRLPFATLAPWPAGLAALAVTHRLVALTPDPAAPPLDALDPGPPTAVLVGAEGPGLSAGALAAADALARIPMAAGVDSLNVATAAGIALHHLRPRRAPGAPL